ncbi:MAG: hypothetical protein O3B13_25685 [Planctomycetota bacterium]|nr:hypothetical protein [Planctomycetota bacterium]MDA1166502.1 hypothetical protein [Planctomycetota bacterium]
MLKPYIGIASVDGLDVFEREHHHVLRFLLRRAYRSKRTGAVCFWAVMDDAIARNVSDLLQSGCRQHALLIIQTLATETGSFCPDDSEWPVLFAG